MIANLNVQDRTTAEAVVRLQRLAYRIEADLIGFDGIPPLHETEEQLQQSEERFRGYYAGDRLAGIIALEGEGSGEVTISRLAVDPAFIRQGIGSALLEDALRQETGATRFTLTTGERNVPAIRLYERYGFQLNGRMEVGPGIWLVCMEKEVTQ
ncbi:GNAT family N-acetyltransferase [Paenibacillus thailandensis]|uniref:GNAT family N-acetyltransferase n=1 Tax=Paenibacillus thailandensis TaxID=393250 RepID=A0ABW5R3C2_9BACL